jgi:hypothetical protein
MSMLDWHRRLHEVTGGMALHWCRASSGELVDWATELRAIAAAMEEAAGGEWPPAEAAKQSDVIPDWLLEMVDA